MGHRPRIGISACLAGERVRYDGGDKRDPVLLEALARVAEIVSFCPEVEAGFGVPREPIQLVATQSVPRAVSRNEPAPESARVLVINESGRDVTAALERAVARLVRQAIDYRLSGFVLKSRSPSCGIDTVPIMASAGTMLFGDGIFVVAIRNSLPALPIADEVALADPASLNGFISRVLAYSTQPR